MSLRSRISLIDSSSTVSEDFVTCRLNRVENYEEIDMHGDEYHHSLLYESPHLPNPLLLALSNPMKNEERSLMSHYLWNSSLLITQLLNWEALANIDLEVEKIWERDWNGPEREWVADRDIEDIVATKCWMVIGVLL